ncbi:MAG TPA: alpha-L-fucosidase [Candidatus Lumbricidophila sp.]|nr:alpha-L-fucosidase [Candidatus Lumbricidophila sp.]
MSTTPARTTWFTDARFGLFVHFGAYSVLGGEEWARSIDRLSIEEYQPAIDGFVPDQLDLTEWARCAAAAGMKYAVLTAKHHDGFCLFDSALTDYTTMHNGLGRDIVAEFIAAFRAEGIRVGLYYSLLDWHHPDYPVVGDAHHPHRDDPAWANHAPQFDRYVDYLHGQVRELVTNYGQIDIIWFDFSYDGMVGEKWRAAELVEMVREHQPNILINNRLETSGGGFGSIVSGHPTGWAGDWVSPEQLIPEGGIRNDLGELVPWEACFTHNNHWGYFKGDESFKSPRLLIRKLVEIVANGGNMLLNVGPMPSGQFPQPSIDALGELGLWLDRNGESVFGAGPAALPKPTWGYYTRRGTTLYAHVLEQPIGPLALVGVPADQVQSMRLVESGATLERVELWLTDAYPDTVFVSFGDNPAFTYPLPDDVDTVIAIELGRAE